MIGRSETPGPGSPPIDPNGASPEPFSSWLNIQGARPYMTRPVQRPWATALKPTGTEAYTTSATMRARREPSGRARRQMPMTPSGRAPRISTVRSRSMAPKNR